MLVPVRGASNFKKMELVTEADSCAFIKTHPKVRLWGKEFELGKVRAPLLQAVGDLALESTNVWSFPQRGNWATHRGDFRGNWSPHIPRNLILRYTNEGDVVLDQMMGSGTTLIECRLLGRTGIGVDINPLAVYISRDRLNFQIESQDDGEDVVETKTYEGDARYLNELPDHSVDFIATHPPYANAIKYSSFDRWEGDLSALDDLDAYIAEMKTVADECLRVLKPGNNCAVMVGDTRRQKHHVPLAFRVMQAFLETGFILREDIIKLQWNTHSGREWRSTKAYDFLLLSHEHLFVFRKRDGHWGSHRDSTKWW